MSEQYTPRLGELAPARDRGRAAGVALRAVALEAAHFLRPGTHFGLASDGRRACISGNPVGVVDPFLKDAVREGEWFLGLLYPGGGVEGPSTHPGSNAVSDELTRLKAENDRLRRDAADAASLRRAFARASEEYGRAFEGKQKELAGRPSPEDRRCMEAWELFYNAVRDHQAGLQFLAEVERLRREHESLLAAVKSAHAGHADDLCWMPADVNRIFKAAGLPPQDLSVGDRNAMIKNCERYVGVLCEGGNWRSYAELEAENARLARELDAALYELARVEGPSTGP